MNRADLKNSLSLLNIFFFAVVAFVFLGCTKFQDYRLYEGSQLPEDKVAILISKGPIVIHSLDGKKNPSGEDTYGPGRYEVLPGDHKMNVSFYQMSTSSELGGTYYYDVFYRNTSTGNVDVNIKTKAGHEYLLTSDYDYKTLEWNFVLVDKTKNEKIVETGPYPLKRVRTGDNRATRRLYLRGR